MNHVDGRNVQASIDELDKSGASYAILSCIQDSVLARAVNAACKIGYRPLGGIMVVPANAAPGGMLYYQAVVKPLPKKTKGGAA